MTENNNYAYWRRKPLGKFIILLKMVIKNIHLNIAPSLSYAQLLLFSIGIKFIIVRLVGFENIH